jgi:TolB-like protein/thioredoxin-like negative regulator of GroEL
VFRVGIAYVVVAWLIMQFADVVINNIGAPDWVFQAILLVLGIAFPVVLLFAWAFEMTPEGLKKEKNVDRSQSVTHQTGRKLDRMIIGIMAVVIAFLVLDRFVLKDESTQTTVATDSQIIEIAEVPEPVVDTGPSVAVLPFVNMSGDKENEYFSDGLTETLLHMLAQLPDLRVAARTSSFAFKGKEAAIAEVSELLGVAHILEGSVQKSGNRVRITAQLIRAEDGFHVWSQNYDRTLDDIFAIQDEIANDVASALDASLLGGSTVIHNIETSDLSAYEAYLKALEQQALGTYSSLPKAQGLLKEAIAADPQFIDAKLALARNYQLMAATGAMNAEDSQRQALPLIQQVLDSNPDNYLARALKLNSALGSDEDFIPEQRNRKYQELRDLLPFLSNRSFLRETVARHLSFIELRHQEAIEILEAGLLTDPLAPNLYGTLGKIFRQMERYDEAMASLQRALALQPDDPGMLAEFSEIKAELGDLNGLLLWLRKAVEADPQDHELTAELAQNFYNLGLPEEGDHWAAKSIALAPQSAVGRKVRLEQAYAHGDMEQALVLAQSMIKDQVSIRHGSFFKALNVYNELMSNSGRQREAYEFLLSVRPELEEFSTFPGDWHGVQIQGRKIELMLAFKSPEEVRQAWRGHAANLDQSFPRWRESTMGQIRNELMEGELDEAERLAIDVFLSKPIASGLRRVEQLQAPQFAAINQRPALMARMSEVQFEKAKLRDGVSEMILEPEWQQ